MACMDNDLQYQVIAESIDYITQHYRDAPDLDFLAARAGYDVTHFQKLFTSMVGISPKKLCRFMAARHARDILERGESAYRAAIDSGLSGGGRLHDLMVSYEGSAPGSIKARGGGLVIRFGIVPSVLGQVLIATTPKGLCWLAFQVDGTWEKAEQAMRARWPKAEFICDDEAITDIGAYINTLWCGTYEGNAAKLLRLSLYGTNFQVQVWRALMTIPYGALVTYQDIGTRIGKPKAARAIGNAVGANPVSAFIPCHRVIRASGIIDNYAWGSARKKLILALENKG